MRREREEEEKRGEKRRKCVYPSLSKVLSGTVDTGKEETDTYKGRTTASLRLREHPSGVPVERGDKGLHSPGKSRYREWGGESVTGLEVGCRMADTQTCRRPEGEPSCTCSVEFLYVEGGTGGLGTRC